MEKVRRGWVRGFVPLAFASAVNLACNSKQLPPEPVAQTKTVAAALNASPKTSDFVVEATNSIKLPTGGLVIDGGDLGARGLGSGPFLSGNVAIDVGTGVTMQATHNLIADSVRLGTGVHVGDVQTNHFTNGTGAVHGSVTALVPLPALPAASVVAPGTANLTVATGATTTAAAFSYATVTVGTGSTLRLPAGTYQIKDVTMSAGARIEALGAVQIRIANRLCGSSGAFIGPKSGVSLTAKDIRIEVSGKNGSGGGITETPRAAAFTSGGSISAIMLVPNGTLQLATGMLATGAFMAKDVDCGGSGAHLVYQDGFPNAGGGCTPASCNDNNPCTTDVCGTNGACTHTPVATGTSCSDGNACNGAETCNASGSCVAGTPVVCTAQDQCHTAGTCDQSTGACTNPAKPAGSSCSDGNACNGAETCSAAGVCQPGTPVTCTALDICHTAGTCDQSTGACTNPAKPAGSSCSDGNACNGAETCNAAGVCQPGTPVTCTALDICHTAGTCDQTTGACSNPAKQVGTSCSDGNACNGNETCNAAGVCQPGTPVTCVAQDACHDVGTCSPTTGQCSNPAKPAGTSCGDGNACNGNETCSATGTCQPGTPVVCTAQDACHDVGTCSPTTGTCSNPTKPVGTSCGDGNACNGMETCSASGACQPGTPVTCTAQDACHDVGTCDASTGVCSNPTAPNGTPCNDNDACTQSDSCQAGACTGSSPVTCVALDQCHAVGTCDKSTGVCSNPNKSDGASCDDGNACTTADACQSGACAGTAVTCSASDQCHTAGVCNPTTGACTNPTLADGTGCSDGNDCTTGDSCQGGSCVSGTSSCTSIAVTETPGGTNTQPQLAPTLAADVTQAVPGDIVSFTSSVTNTGMLLDVAFWTFSIQNNGSSPFLVKGYQQTLEYFSVSQQAWIPFGKLAYDADGNPVPITDPTLLPLQWAFASPFFGNNVTFGPGGIVGTSIAPGGSGTWLFRLSPIIPADVVNVLFDPAEASDLRAVIKFDVPSGSPPAQGAASFASALSGVTGEVDDLAVQMHFPAPNTLDPTGTPMTSLETGPLAPGASRTFTVQLPAPPMLPRDPSETDAGYIGRLYNTQFFSGYFTYASPTGQSLTENPFPPNGGLFLGIELPVITPQKSGPATSNAGLTQTYTVALANSGHAAAGPFAIVDSVDGSPVSTAVTAPNVAPGATGSATVAAPSPLDRPAGPMTDTVAVSWQDRNGNSYGPVGSSFTTNLGAGHPEGYLTVAGGTGIPQTPGTPKTLTATALDPLGQPVSGVQVQITIMGVNPQTTTITTGADGTATFAYAGPNLGPDTIVASATITTTPVQSAAAHLTWATSVGPPCTGRGTPLDLIFVIDGSPSMFDGNNVAAAQAASDKFIDEMDLSIDQVGAVTFSGNAGLIPLTTDGATAKSEIDTALFDAAHACDGFCGGGSNFSAAFQLALAEFQGPRHRPGASPLMIFISDGGFTGTDPTPDVAALKAAGVRIVSVGMGTDVAVNVMTQIATSKNEYFYAPTSSELSWVYSYVNHDICSNPTPIVSAGGNQGAYEVRLPDLLTLNGEVHDVNGVAGDTRLSTEWTLVSGPGTVTFTDASSPVTQALFAAPGTYVVQLEATDGFLTTADRATVTVDPDPSIVGADLEVALGSSGPLTTGATETLTATLTDGLGAPISNFVVQLTIAGANPLTSTLVTNASGAAVFTYQGGKPGTDQLHATAIGTTLQLDSDTLTVQWTEPASGGPVLTQGWIASPVSPSTVTGQVPIVLSPTITLASGTVTFWPTSAPDQVHTVASGVSGAPSTAIATFDSTLLANGTYIIKLDGTNDAGDQKVSEVAVTVSGDYKPGRVVVEVTDLSIPVAGLPITVGRRYDSLEKDNVGDFGHGWSLILGHPKLEVDPAHDVTLTMPDGRRVTFYLTPTSYPFPFRFLFPPTFVPEPGVFGQLTSDGCDPLLFVDGKPICFLDTSSELAPTNYTYTDPYGRQFSMAATGELKSIKDRQGNTLTFASNGIVSSPSGLTVQFARDTQGRITKVTSPSLDIFGTTIETDYSYDAAGNLETVTLPPNEATAVMHYTYDGAHRLLTTVDPRGNTARTSTYDTAGRLATDKDALGNLTSYAYDLTTRTTQTTNPDTGVVTQVMDDRGLLLSEIDPLGRTTKSEYDSNRNETKRTNALGQVRTRTYNANGNPTSLTDALGRTSYTTWDAFSKPTAFTDALGHTSTSVYDDRGLPISSADELGTRFKYTSSEQGAPLTVDDAEGNRAYLTYDTAGNVTSQTDWLGRVATFTYDDLGRKLTETTPRGGVTRYFYRPSGLVYATQDPATVAFGSRVFDHDQNGNVVSVSWPLASHVTNATYDALNHVTQIQHGDGATISYTRDFRGMKLTATDELGRTTTHKYDLAGQLLKTTFADGTFTVRTYDAIGRLETVTDERGNITSYEYDPGCGCSDRVTTVTDPLGRATTTLYDALGRRTSVTDAAGRTTSFAYDVRNHALETDYPDGTSVHDAYDVRGRRTSTTDQTGATTTYGYDDQGQLTSVKDALGNVTHYTYDLDGNLSSVADANGGTTAYSYDLAERKTSRQMPLGQSENFAYDAVGNQISHTDFRGKTTTMTYDARDRKLTTVPDPSLGEPTVTYGYFATGARSSMTDASGSTAYTYDQRNRLLTKATAAGTLTYSYDASGNVVTTRSSNANGTSVDYAWDAANELVSVTDNRVGGMTTAAYTSTGRRSTVSMPTGVGMTYAYDALDRVTSLAWQGGTSPPFASWGYDYNARGQRTNATDVTGRQVAYGYDAVSRLTSETITSDPRGAVGDGALTYTLDPVGNRLTRTSTLAALGAQVFSYNANDQLTTDGYDLNGNTTSSDGHTYAYDFENRLVSKDGGAVTVVYDGDGNRVAKTTAGVTTRYLVDELNPTGYLQVMEEISGGAVQTRYTFGSSLVSQTRDVSTLPATSYYGYDAHGNITFLTNPMGTLTDSYEYDGFGNLVGATGSTRNFRLYGGEEFDPDLGLINLRARQYDPGRGRFESEDSLFGDPLRPLTQNRYLYTLGDPANSLDPSGHVTIAGYTLALAIATITLVIANHYHPMGFFDWCVAVPGAVGVSALDLDAIAAAGALGIFGVLGAATAVILLCVAIDMDVQWHNMH